MKVDLRPEALAGLLERLLDDMADPDPAAHVPYEDKEARATARALRKVARTAPLLYGDGKFYALGEVEVEDGE